MIGQMNTTNKLIDPSQKFAVVFFQDPGRKLEKSTAGKLIKETG